MQFSGAHYLCVRCEILCRRIVMLDSRDFLEFFYDFQGDFCRFGDLGLEID